MERVMTSVLESASLFEVNVPDYKHLRACRRESLLLKMLWDYVFIARTSIDDWKTTLWREINVEQMDLDCNRFSKDIKLLDKDVRAWNVYTGAESTVKNMMTSLKAVTELQNPAIRDRHWQQLMKATGVRIHHILFTPFHRRFANFTAGIYNDVMNASMIFVIFFYKFIIVVFFLSI